MSDWEDYADEALATKSASPAVPVTAVASKWDDEDADEPVKDAWDDDDTKTSKPHAAARSALSATTPPKKKKSMAHAIAQRKEEDERRLKQLAEKKAAIEAQRQQDEDGHANETPSERRARLQKAVEAEDARNINDLFGDVSIKDKAVQESDNPLVTLVPTSMDDFDTLQQALSDRFAIYEKHGLYVAFLESFVKTVSDRLKVEDVRKLSTMLNTLANEKQRAEKDQQKKKKSSKAKAQVRVAAGDEDGDEEAYAGGGSRGFYEHDYDDLYGAC